MANPQIIVEFISRTTDLKKGFAETESSATSTGSKLKSFGKVALRAAGAAGLGALVYTLHAGVGEYMEAQKVAAQTNAVLKSTGNAAHVSAQHVDDLASSLMQKSGVDDEAIKSGENLLLTFTGIRNQAGKNNDVFDQATKIMLDMSVALGQDMKSSAIQLGKALNDPVKGMTALQRVGVSFTEQQKKQVQAMVKSGDTLGAQKLILRELNKEFGGSAEAIGKTMPGQVNILKENFNNLAGEIVGTLAPALQVVTKLFAENPALVKVFTIAILALAAAMVAMNVALAITSVLSAGIAVPLLIATGAVIGLAAAAYLIYKNWNDILKWLKGAWQTVSQAITKPFVEVIDWLKQHWEVVAAIIGGPFGLAVAEIVKHRDAIIKAVKDTFDAVFNLVWNTGRGIVNTVAGAFQDAGQAIWNSFAWVFNSAWSAGQEIIKGLVAGVKGIGGSAWQAISDVGQAIWNQFQTIWDWGKAIGTWIVQGVTGTLKGIGGAAWGVISEIGSTIGGAFNTIWGWGKSIGKWIWDGLMAGIRGIGKAIMYAIKAPINAVIGGWNNLRIAAFTIKLPHLPDVHFGGFDLPNLPYLQHGGIVTGPTLAVLGEAGPEMVLPLNTGSAPVEVHVYIGDVELRSMIRTEVITQDNRTAQTLLAGLAR